MIMNGNHMIRGIGGSVRQISNKIGQSSTKKMKGGFIHQKARCPIYPRTKDVKRFPVPDDKVSWDVPFPEYNPTVFTTETVLGGPYYADPDICSGKGKITKWNEIDGKVSRVSFEGTYKLQDGLPLNPKGRTGLKHRGCLGRWGPNHAADPIVTRWKRNENGEVVKATDGKPIMQFVAVQRRDNHEWAIPGGMVDPGDLVTATIKKEFGEEALNSLEMSEEQKKTMHEMVEGFLSNGDEGKVDAGEVVTETLLREFGEEALSTKEISEEEKNAALTSMKTFFSCGDKIYRGYVDDPRNTDNAWMETVAYNFHDSDGTKVGQFNLHAGDDAMAVQWMDCNNSIKLYASHVDFLQKVAKLRDASW